MATQTTMFITSNPCIYPEVKFINKYVKEIKYYKIIKISALELGDIIFQQQVNLTKLFYKA